MAKLATLRRPLTLLVVATLFTATLAGCFVWGYFVHRDQVFPYHLLLNLAVQADLVAPPRLDNHLVRRSADPHAAVNSLPYVSGTMDPRSERSGVYLHREDRAFQGWNLFTPLLRSQAFLLGMDQEVVHRWRADSGEWQHVELLPGGDLLVMIRHGGMMRLDPESKVQWRHHSGYHHDFSVAGDGRIYALNRRNEVRPEFHPSSETVVDLVTILSPEGEPLGEISILDLLQESPYAFLLPRLGHRDFQLTEPLFDVLHTNHVEVFDGRLAHLSPIYRAGNLLLSLRTISTVLILDPQAEEIVWAWGPGNLTFQHHPTLLDDGHLLIFDNGIDRSEVVEVDPLTYEVVWRYNADDFFSRERGSAQRLPNGNTLITESDTGYVFEVTPAGDRVWAFANPVFTEDGKRMAIWRMTRFFPGDPRLPAGLR